MVKYLINRPIAVIISFIAIVVIGLTVAGLLPVSLLPDIKIPEITVYVTHPNTTAADLERSIVAGLRARLLQLPGLEDIQSETRDNKAIIRLKFSYGTNTDFAFIEVNDKVDAAMAGLPREVRRPGIIKASATDIPVFLLNVSLNDPLKNRESSKFMELSSFTETVIRKRMEQLSSVAFADLTGAVSPELYIIPDKARCQSLGVSVENIELALKQNNISVSGIIVRDGLLQYSLIFKNELRSADDVKNILISVHGEPVPLKDLADVGMRPQMQQGLYLSQGKQALCLALVKSSDARIETMRDEVNSLVEQLRASYPEINFETSQDQSYLLTFTIDNLRSNLLQGCFLAILVMFLFIRNYRSPLLIALTLPVTLIISLFFFYLFRISINIVSLSGLILGVGMMIDNSIVVIDNIIQHQQRGASLDQAIAGGTNEVIAPMISSTLTSCAVFIPLIFLSGIAGALFYDQAIAIAIGQGISLLVSITLTPALYHLVHKRPHKYNEIAFLGRVRLFDMEQSYVKGFDFIFRHQKATALFLLLIMGGGFFAYRLMDKRTLPVLPETETILTIDWNQNIHVDENKRRIIDILNISDSLIEQSNAFIGEQQFLLNPDLDISPFETSLYLKAGNQRKLKKLKDLLNGYLSVKFPTAIFSFSSPENPFIKVFSGKESQLTARIRSLNSSSIPPFSEIEKFSRNMSQMIQGAHKGIPLRQQYLIKVRPEMLFRYNVDFESIATVLKTAFNSNYADKLMADDRYVPIVIGSVPLTMDEAMATLFVMNQNGEQIPVRNLAEIEILEDYRTIYGGREGVFVPVNIDVKSNETPEVIRSVENLFANQTNLQVSFSGSYFSNRKLIREMIIIFIISALLLFFILAAQFESLSTPLVVLAELPIDLAFALLFLWMAGSSVNAMSLIGFIVMGGIIINDSILKIDTINQLRKEGYELLEAIHEGGRRRLKPIVMTALVTVIALLPQMLGSDLGAKLQLPLSIAMLGGMTAGTLVSLWIIPLLYYHIISLGNKLKNGWRKNMNLQ